MKLSRILSFYNTLASQNWPIFRIVNLFIHYCDFGNVIHGYGPEVGINKNKMKLITIT